MSEEIRGNGTKKIYLEEYQDGSPETPCPLLVEEESDEMSDDKPIENSPEPECYDESFQKKVQWGWWVFAILIGLVSSGFGASRYLSSTFIDKDLYQRERSEHRDGHSKIEQKMDQFEASLDSIKINQAVESERNKVINSRIELLIQRTEEPDSRQERIELRRQEKTLLDRIQEQEERLMILEKAR